MAGLTLASPSAERRVYSPWRETWRRYSRHKLAVVSAFLLLVLVLAVVFGPFVWRVKIDEIDIVAGMQGPSPAHPFGTDDLGQDILARMIYGGRISLAVGLAAMLVSVFIGVLIGALAGMSRGALGHGLMWLTDLFLSLPQLPLLLLLIYLFRDGLKQVFGPEGGIFILIVLVIGGSAGCRSRAWCARSSCRSAKRNSWRLHVRSVQVRCGRWSSTSCQMRSVR